MTIYSETNINMFYNEYLRQRESSFNYAKRQGLPIRKVEGEYLRTSTKSEFLVDLKSVLGDNPKLSAKTAARQLAKREVYSISPAQGRNFEKAFKSIYGREPKFNEKMRLRLGDPKVLDPILREIKTNRSMNRNMGYGNEQIRLKVGQKYFESK